MVLVGIRCGSRQKTAKQARGLFSVHFGYIFNFKIAIFLNVLGEKMTHVSSCLHHGFGGPGNKKWHGMVVHGNAKNVRPGIFGERGSVRQPRSKVAEQKTKNVKMCRDLFAVRRGQTKK